MSGGKTVFELRIHGVSGTPPEAMLNCPTEFLDLKKGNRDAAFYRRADWIDETASQPVVGPWRRRMEAYSWGGLTSRRASRALWLLLLPFSLVNLAHWMLPPAHRRGPAAVVVAALRLLALSFTLTLLLAMAVAVLDIAVWQCANIGHCSSGWGPLAFLSEKSVGARLAFGAAPFIVVIAVLWVLGREETSSPATEEKHLPPPAVVGPQEHSPLADETFWNQDASVRRMRACHVTAWTAGLAALVLAAPVAFARSGLTGVVNVTLLAVNSLILLLAIVATGLTGVTGRGGRPAHPRTHFALMGLRYVALAVLGATLLWVGFRGGLPDNPAATYLPGLRPAIYGLLAVQGSLLAVVFAGTALSMRGRPKLPAAGDQYQPTLKGFTGPFVALLGWLIGGALSVGVGIWVAQILGKLVFSTRQASHELLTRSAILINPGGDIERKIQTMNAPPPLLVPPPYLWSSAALVVLVVVAAAVVIHLVRKAFRSGTALVDPVGPECDAPAEVTERIAGSRALASLTDAGPGLIAALTLMALPLLVVLAVLFRAFPWLIPHGGFGTGVILFFPVAIVVVMVLLVVQGFRNREVRRGVAILWDVVTFWPRSTHPLTPPSYGGRTVLDLRLRMDELTTNMLDGTPATRVVLVAHSQGTIIAAATLMQCHKPEERYPLLTFGSPLRRLYAKNFPAYFGYRAMTTFRRELAAPHRRWINLWAHTDAIGSWVFDPTWVYYLDEGGTRTMEEALDHTDCRILDLPQDPTTGSYAMCADGPLCGHGGFWDREEFTAAVNALQTRVVPGDEGDVTDTTAPPTDQAM